MSLVEFQSHQIVYLECGEKRLYAEVIQTVIDRGLCWARPVVMMSWQSSNGQPFPFWSSHQAIEITPEMLTDLRQESDLLLPLSWFHIAVDTDVIPVLAQLNEIKPESDAAPGTERSQHSSAQEQLRVFIQMLCVAHQAKANPDQSAD